jgi:HlyD family secretion protein
MDNKTISAVTTRPGVTSRRHRPRQWPTLLLFVALAGGLLVVLWFVYREQLVPAVAVQTDKVVLLAREPADGTAPAEAEPELLFQASGWTEADPWPVAVSVFTDGIVDEIHVREGESVTNGQILARLDQADAQLDIEAADLQVQVARAALRTHSNTLVTARLRLLSGKAGVDGAAARVAEARDTWERITALPRGDVTALERSAARRALAEGEAELEVARFTVRERESAIAELTAQTRHRRATLAVAVKQREIAALALSRTVVRAPTDGVVLRRYAQPGTKRGPLHEHPDSATIVTLFDPRNLQVRVDVPIAEAGRLAIGRPTRISTALLPGQVLTGRVTRIVGEADLQRNTLQAKVAIADPDPRLRPEVLCRVEFWHVPEELVATPLATGGGGDGRYSLWVPETALADPAVLEQNLWVVDPIDRTVRRRGVRLGRQKRDGYRLVLEGLHAGETVVTGGAATLEDGRRVKQSE